ncbi:MAG: hypothetical protein WCI03_05555 [bacterium]
MDTTLSTLMIDGHVHIYKHYDWTVAINALITNLSLTRRTLAPNQPVIPIGLLAESTANRFYNEVIERGSPLTKGSLQLEAGPNADSLVIREFGIIKGYLIAGRQWVTSENLEVLALGRITSISKRLPLQETIQAITEQGGVPVLSWSPGKWFFGRGKLVKSLITSNAPESFLIGDIGLRPTLWPKPGLMKLAIKQGFKIIGGSDSLPRPGEECWIGRTGFQAAGEFDTQNPAASLRHILLNHSSEFIPVGQHSSLMAFASRWGRNQWPAPST